MDNSVCKELTGCSHLRVAVNGLTSKRRSVMSAALQRPVLGPELFNIFVGDVQ